MEMTSFAPEEFFVGGGEVGGHGGGGEIAVHRKIHTGKLDFSALLD